MPRFETAFQAHLTTWRLDGQPRTARRYPTDRNCPLPTPEDRLLLILIYLPADLSAPSRAGTTLRHGSEQSPSVDSCPLGGVAGHATRAGRCAHPVCDSTSEAPQSDRGRRERHGCAGAGAAESVCTGIGPGPCRPPVVHDGTERRLGRRQDPTAQTRYYRGKKKCHTVKNVLLINAVQPSSS